MLDEREDADRTTFEGQVRDDFLKLVHASQDPRFKGKTIAVGTDGLVRPGRGRAPEDDPADGR